MRRKWMIKMANNLREELKDYELDSAERMDRGEEPEYNRARARAYKHAGELVEGMIDCWRFV